MNDPNQPRNNGHKWQTFFQFNVGHLLIIIGMLGTAFWWFVNYDRDFVIAKMEISQLLESNRLLGLRVEGIDSNGTHFSQKGIDKELDLYKSNVDRLNHLEQVQSELLPKVEKLDYKVSSVLDWIEEQKKKPK